MKFGKVSYRKLLKNVKNNREVRVSLKYVGDETHNVFKIRFFRSTKMNSIKKFKYRFFIRSLLPFNHKFLLSHSSPYCLYFVYAFFQLIVKWE